jgi:lipopolysaccharide assembly outer membrane protein LptD (OstA)
MPDAKSKLTIRRLRPLFALLVIFLVSPHFTDAQDSTKSPAQNPSAKQSPRLAKTPPGGPANGDQTATLEADQQRQVGNIYYADGNVDVRYENTRLRADHVEYNEDTYVVIARGHVQLDYMCAPRFRLSGTQHQLCLLAPTHSTLRRMRRSGWTNILIILRKRG